jgi:hypothetical protein
MKETGKFRIAVSILFIIIILSAGCKTPETPLYTAGTFPDSVYTLDGINTQYDDYNMDLAVFGATFDAIFSSNRKTNGGKFDLVTGSIGFMFDKESGAFSVTADLTSHPFMTSLATAANTDGDDFGPYRLLSRHDSHEYLITTTEEADGTLDLKYLRYIPALGSNAPVFGALTPAKILNSTANDGYITFDITQNRVFFSSDRGGVFDIYMIDKPENLTLADWFALDPATVTKTDSVNSGFDDKCPIVSRNVMVFTSNRPEGLGGFDLYYSVYQNGKWGSPVNFGPGVNSEYNEYRPIIGYHPDFTNYFLIFSSDRPGGKGGYDLYFTGVEIPGVPALISK